MIEYDFWPEGAQNSDIDCINTLLEQLTTTPREIDLPELIEISRNSRLLLAREATEGQVIGMATLAIVTILAGRIGRIEDVVVDTEYRGQGIGRCLMERLITEAESIGLDRLELTSNPARVEANRLYQELGFLLVATNAYRLKMERR